MSSVSEGRTARYERTLFSGGDSDGDFWGTVIGYATLWTAPLAGAAVLVFTGLR